MVLVLLAGGCGAAATPPCPPRDEGAPRATASAAAASSAEPGASEAVPEGMVRVAAGEFLRGSKDDVGLEDERPQRSIHLDAFAIDRTEVPIGDYQRCVAAGKCRAPACTEDGDVPEDKVDHPVVCVTWADADGYCRWAGKRLPTEAEWEKAARGADARSYPWGEGEPTCNRANYHDCGNARRAVGSLPAGASPYGALDMAGNVYEWVADWHHRDYYALCPARNPEGPWSGKKKIVRGGAFSYDADELNTHGRTFDLPTKAYDQVGFRCARSL
jgi:serine/threonine-protein kinase